MRRLGNSQEVHNRRMQALFVHLAQKELVNNDAADVQKHQSNYSTKTSPPLITFLLSGP